MPVETRHPAYNDNVVFWRRCRIAIAGEDDVKAAGEEYLPKLREQEVSEYEAYKKRAVFFNATARTIDGIAGAVFRKDPELVGWEPRFDAFLEKVGGSGVSVSIFSKKILKKVLGQGRYGVLIDFADEDVSAGAFPYWVGYQPEAIINWKETVIGNETVLTMVVLEETHIEQDTSDRFVFVEVTKYRVLSLNADEDSFFYHTELWKKNPNKESKEKYVLESEFFPTLRGKKLNYIPFTFFNVNDLSSFIEKSPIIDIVSINLSHYRNSADLEHGRHFTALPTPWVAGFETQEELFIGSSKAWVSENPDASAGYLEFSGSGLGSIKEGMDDKEAMMAILGARLLEAPRKTVEATETHKLRRSGEDGITASLALTISKGLTQLLRRSAEWLGAVTPDEVSIDLNADFVSVEMSPQMLASLMGVLQAGKISYDTFFHNLRKGELVPDGRTMEQELDLNDSSGPSIVGNEEVLPLDDEDDDLGAVNGT